MNNNQESDTSDKSTSSFNFYMAYATKKHMNNATIILSFIQIGSNNVPDKAARSYIWYRCR